jgi:hypothetical protein
LTTEVVIAILMFLSFQNLFPYVPLQMNRAHSNCSL